ncbi:MAG: alpha/beta hydrolase, partial [Myxococcota bacterium]
MKKLIAVAALVPLLLYALLVAVTYVGQRKLQYHPDRENPAAPAGILDVELVAEDGPRIRAWVTESEGKDAVLILHGNGGNRSNLQSVLFGFRDRGLRAMIVDYRGYGGSEGEPSEEGLYADAEAAWNWLKKNGATRVG